MRAAVSLAIIWLLATHSAAASEPRIVVDGEIGTVVGRVDRIVAYGPPGFGEDTATDRREDYFALRLDSPLRGRTREGDLEKETAKVQLFYMGDWPKNFLDALNAALRSRQPVTIRGEAVLAQNGHHHEPILVSVRTLSARR